MLGRWRRQRRRAPSAAAPGALLAVNVDHGHDGAVDVWAVSGEIDMATRARLEEVRDAVASEGGPLLLDLTGVTFMDSTGLAALLKIHRAAAASGRPLTIVCPEGPARLLLAVSGIEAQLPLHATRASALAALR